MSDRLLTPRQVRALILLLIVAPLVPAALMLQLMISSVSEERVAAAEHTQAFYGQALSTAASTLAIHLKTDGGTKDLAGKASAYLEQCFAKDARVRMIPPGAAVPMDPAAPPLAELQLEAPLAGWRVELFPLGPNTFDDALHYQIVVFAVIAGGAILFNMTIACLTGYALNRQMRVQELKSSSLETISHELRTPLASVRVLLDTLLERDLAEPAGDYVRLISAENSRLIHLVESFLTFARLERGGLRFERQPVAPTELLEAARERAGCPRAEVRMEVAAQLPNVLVDKEAVTVALANLIGNAVKYSNGHKEITLRAARGNKGVEFQVIDHGIGIPSAEQKRVFDRFYQVNQTLARTHEGCGLGLSIVKSIVTAHGGRVEISSREGEGTTVGVLLPCS